MKMIMMIVVGGAIFGASAAGSWFLQKQSQKPETAEAHDDAAASTTDSHVADAAHPTALNTTEKAQEGLPATVRPRPVSVEELLRYSLGLKSREETIGNREKEIERRQAQVNIVLADIQGEQQELDGLRSQVKQQLSSVESMLDRLQKNREEFEADKLKASAELEQIKTSQQSADAAQWDNIKKMSTWFQSMEPEKAATVLKELSDNGQMDLAVQLLSSFGEREASKVLSAIEDTSLTVQLAEAFRTFKKPQKPEEKRR